MLAITLALLLAADAPSSAPTAEALPPVLRFEIVGLRNLKGAVLCALHDKAEAYPDKAKLAARTAQTLVDDDKKAVCEFAGLAPGDYALSVIHDENNNKQMDTNFIGMPQEGVGASRNAKGFMGPPKFQDAKVRYEGVRMVMKVNIVYL